MATNPSAVGGGVLSAQAADALAFGLSFWTAPPTAQGNGHQFAVNTLVVALSRAVKTETIGKLGIWVGVGGVTTGAGINGLALYSAAGSLLGQTGDMTTAFQTVGYTEGTITGGVAVTAGTAYFLAMMHNFTGTAPTMPSAAAAITYPLMRNIGLNQFLGSQTSFPASFTPGTNLLSFVPFIAAGV